MIGEIEFDLNSTSIDKMHEQKFKAITDLVDFVLIEAEKRGADLPSKESWVDISSLAQRILRIELVIAELKEVKNENKI